MRVFRAAGWVALALAAVIAMAAVLPLQPKLLDAPLDDSFAAVLNDAAAQPAAQRPRLISTYGPLGFAQYSLYLPETYPALLAIRTALGAVCCWAIAWLGWAAWASPWGGALALLACAPLIGGADTRGLVLVALVPLTMVVRGRPAPRTLRLALGAAIGTLTIVKATFFTAAAVVFGPLALGALLARRLPLTALAALATAGALWLSLGLSGKELAAYLDWSLREITSGYTLAMQLRTTTALVEHVVAVSAVILAWFSVLAWRSGGPGWWALPIAFAGALLLQFKAGFVRADIHVFITVLALLAEGVLLAVSGGRRPVALLLGGLLVAAVPGALLWHAGYVGGAPTPMFRVLWPRDLIARLAAIPAVARGDAFSAAHERRVRDLRGMMAVPSFEGGVDMIGHWQGLLLANRSPYRPRPVFQGYMAYTPRLAAENAAFLTSDAAPRWLLFDVETIDGRFPTLDDAALWPELLSRYRPAGTVGRYALLERRATPRPWRLVPLGGVDAQTDQPIAVPASDGGPIWARIDVHETLAERLETLLFAGPYQFVDIVFVTNAVWRARLVPAIARDGFLLSPAVGSVAAFVALSNEGPGAVATRSVREIRVHVDTPLGKPAGPHPVRIDFARLEMAAER